MKINRTVTYLVASSLMSCSINLAAEQVVGTINHRKHFDGIYLGAQLGVDRISANINAGESEDSDFNYEALLGYRYQTDNDWVIGIEGRFGDRNGELSDQNVEFKFDRLWRLLPTIGKTFGQNGNNLVYGKLGVGGIRLDAKVNGTTLTSQNFEGVVGAIGYERALSDKLSLHTELSYISYDPDFDHWQPMVGVLVKF